jgi:hypothetical protein
MQEENQHDTHVDMPNHVRVVGNTKTTKRGGESVVYELKQFYTF